MTYTHSVGNVIELQCMSKFNEMGFVCSIPYGNQAKYDFIAELPDGKLIKIQCKSPKTVKDSRRREKDDVFTLDLYTQTINTRRILKHEYEDKDVDYFATYYKGQVYLIPKSDCSHTKTLRLIPPANNQANYCKAEDYTIEKILGSYQSQSFIDQLENGYNFSYEERVRPRREYKTFYCSRCGINEVTEDGALCLDCSHLLQRKCEHPSRDELKSLIREKSFSEIGRDYNVTDNAVRKWCRQVQLPFQKNVIKSYSDVEWNEL